MDHSYFAVQRSLGRKKRVTTYCCVPQCRTYFSPEISFHIFPKDPILKQKWETALNMGKRPSSSMRVCSHHFVPRDFFPVPIGAKRHRLFPHAVPSQRIPQWLDDNSRQNMRKKHKESVSTKVRKRNPKRRSTEENLKPTIDTQFRRKVEALGKNVKAKGKKLEKYLKFSKEEGISEEVDESLLMTVEEDVRIKPEIEDPEEAEEYLLTQFEMSFKVEQYQYDKCIQVSIADQRSNFLKDEEGWSLADIICENSLDKTTQVHFRGK